MATLLSNSGKNAALDGLASSAAYASLHTGDPSTTGANEVTGGSPAYARSGTASGHAVITGTARGSKRARQAVTVAGITPHATMRGVKHATAVTYARMTLRAQSTGLHHAGTPQEQERRRHDEDALLLLRTE